MADVLSLAASIIAVLGAAEGIAKTLSKIRTIRNAPNELYALINEVSDLRIILGNVQSYVQSAQRSQISQEHLQHLSIFVDRVNETLLQVDELVHYKVLKPQSSSDNLKISKIEWLKAVKKIDKFRQSLRDMRLNIITYWIMINSSDCTLNLRNSHHADAPSTHQSRNTLTIDKVHIVSGNIQASQQSLSDSTRLQFDELTRLLNGILHGQASQHSSNDSTRFKFNEHTRLLNNVLHGQANIQSMLQLQQTSNTPNQLPPIEAVLRADNQSLSPVLHIRACASYNQWSPCAPHCKCTCHHVRSFKSPSVLHEIIGTLFAGYSGYPERFQRCTVSSCESQATIRVYIHYLFPSWFLIKAITIAVLSNSIGEINAALTMRRIVPGGADVLRLAQLDDVESMKELLRSRLASPNDSLVNGSTVLEVAISYNSLKVCDLLLKAGADPHLTSFDGHHSAYSHAWDTIFGGSRSSEESEALRDLFPYNEDLVADRKFSSLHKAVLKLEYYNLEQQIQTHRLFINSTDVNGYTALLWATRRGDNDAIKILVKAGADINYQNHIGTSALHYAAKYADSESVRVLLKAGANYRQVSRRGFSALHYAAQYAGKYDAATQASIIQCLIKAGADPNAQNKHGASILQQCAGNNNVTAAETLLENGASINLLDNDGDSAVFQCLLDNANDVTQLLLSRGATYTSWDSMGNSILHMAALSGDLRTLGILRKAELQDVDPDAPNRQAQTILQLAQARVSKPDDFIPKLQELLMEIRIRSANLRETKMHQRAESDHQTEKRNDGYHLKYLASFRAKFKARIAHRMRSDRRSTQLVSILLLRKFVVITLLVALAYYGLSYIFMALNMVVRWTIFLMCGVCLVMGSLWSFEELRNLATVRISEHPDLAS